MGQHVCIISVIATVLSPRKVDVCRPARSRARTDTTLLQQGHERLVMDEIKRRVSAHGPRKRVAECVSGVLIGDGAVLVEKRRADDDADPGLVLLPRGHVESGELLNRALKREARRTGDQSRKGHTDSSPLLYGLEWGETENTLFSYQGL